MKIALSGPQGTGKTTIMKDLVESREFLSLEKEMDVKFEFLPEIVRSLRSVSGMEINEKGTFETELLVLTTHIRNLLIYENFVTDRCMIDNMIYTLMSKDFEGKQKYVAHNEFLIEKLFDKYDLVFYIRNEFQPPEDGTRNLEDKFFTKSKELFEKTYQNLMKKYDNIIILKGDRQERVDKIIKEIRRKLNGKRT